MSRIPAEVWRFCMDQIKLYPLRVKQLQEEKQKLAQTVNNNLDNNPDTLFDESSDEETLVQSYVYSLESSIQKMDDVIKGLEADEKAVLQAVWDIGWRNNEAISAKAGFSIRTIAKHKHTVIERLAIRWGMW